MPLALPAAKETPDTLLSTGCYLTAWRWMRLGRQVALDTGVADTTLATAAKVRGRRRPGAARR